MSGREISIKKDRWMITTNEEPDPSNGQDIKRSLPGEGGGEQPFRLDNFRGILSELDSLLQAFRGGKSVPPV